MKSIKDIMSELGFDSLGNEDTQKAFIRHLIREAARSDNSVKRSESTTTTTKAANAVAQKNTEPKPSLKTLQEQLSFDFDDNKQVS